MAVGGGVSSLRPSPRSSRAASSEAGSSRRVSSRSPTPEPPLPRLSPAVLTPIEKQPSRRASREQQQQVEVPSQQVAKKERSAAPVESRSRALRSKWAVKTHFSLPAERKDSKWVKIHEDSKSKSLKERPKYSIRRRMSPDPDPRLVMRGVDNRVVRKLISPEVSLGEAKWAPYEGYSPLPNVGMKKRETKKMISDIKWRPYTGDESPLMPSQPPPAPEVATEALEEESMLHGAEDPPRTWSPFHNITPTHLPPPAATPMRNEDEEFRWRFLNQVSAFPIYQGAWREETPPPSPPPPDLGTPIWSPQEPKRQPSPLPPPSPSPPPQKRSTLKLRSSSSKKKSTSRAKSQESTRHDDRRHTLKSQLSSAKEAMMEEPVHKRQRPQLLRSKALTLDVPKIDPSKRSLSEEVRSHSSRTESTKRGFIFRAKSEDAARRYSQRKWLDVDRQEVREYVTTV